MSIAENLAQVREGIAEACIRAGRQASEVTLVAVSKTVEPDRVAEAIRAGALDLGENWVQEAVGKKPVVEKLLREHAGRQLDIGDCRLETANCGDALERRATSDELLALPRWHMIGHLQTNKVKKALEVFDVFQGVDSLHLAQELNRRAGQVGRVVETLIEVNTSGEASKFGATPDQVVSLAGEVLNLKALRLTGLMTIGPGLSVEDPETARPCFRLLRELRDRLQSEFRIVLPCLSMGMSSDHVVAIQEESTMVRIGTAIFGARGNRTD